MFQIELKYKGNRTYLQGGDIFNALMESFLQIGDGFISRLVLKSFAINQIKVLHKAPDRDKGILGNGLWKYTDGSEQRFWLQETEEPVTDSYSFNEDAITDEATLSGEAILLEMQNEYTLIENIIALTKRLNYLLSPDVRGKWLFGQIDLHRALPEYWKLIEIERKICVGNSFSRNIIQIDGDVYGEIRFIGGEV